MIDKSTPKLDKALGIYAKRHNITDPTGDVITQMVRYIGAGAYSDEQLKEMSDIYKKLK